MNKSILKHEIRSMKWMLLLSVLASLFLTIMFSISLDREYVSMFYDGIHGSEALVKRSLEYITVMTLVIFTSISIVQIFMQFRSEKNQETGRFLKSLPVKKEEFFKIKIVTGLINLTLAFIVLAVGLVIVRNNNMFWIKDTHALSYASKAFIKADGVGNLLKQAGLMYLVVLSFYTFLFMIQYTFTNVIGGIVTGILVWIAPIFIAISSMYTLENLGSVKIYNTPFMAAISNYSELLLPWIYVFEQDYNILPYGIKLGSMFTIPSLGLKYIICLLLILVNIIVAYKFNKSSKVENENKVIVFKGTRNIFKLGVTVCSGLLVSVILGDIMMMQISNIVYVVLVVLGGAIGYWISDKISKVGSI